MSKKVVLITGATGGIGKQTAIALAEMDYSVVVTGRNEISAQTCVEEIKQLTENNDVDFLIGNVSTIKGVKKIASQFKNKYSNLDVLINNAGSASANYFVTEDGIEINFAVNVMAPYLLSKLLNNELMSCENPRLITLTGGDLPSKIDLQNLQYEKKFDGLNSYSQSKIAMMTLMCEYAQQMKSSKLTINVCYPGQASTSMTQSVTADMLPSGMRLLFPIFKWLVKPDGGKSAKKASRSSVYLATSDAVKNRTGIYINKRVKEVEFPKVAVDSTNRKFLWEYVNNLIKDKAKLSEELPELEPTTP